MFRPKLAIIHLPIWDGCPKCCQFSTWSIFEKFLAHKALANCLAQRYQVKLYHECTRLPWFPESKDSIHTNHNFELPKRQRWLWHSALRGCTTPQFQIVDIIVWSSVIGPKLICWDLSWVKKGTTRALSILSVIFIFTYINFDHLKVSLVQLRVSSLLYSFSILNCKHSVNEEGRSKVDSYFHLVAQRLKLIFAWLVARLIGSAVTRSTDSW